jgi:hypothetical protein
MTQTQTATHGGITPGLHDKNLRILNRIQSKVGGEIRISARGVPHLVYKQFSVVRFGSKKLRVFSPHPSKDQERQDFGQWPHVVQFLQEQ